MTESTDEYASPLVAIVGPYLIHNFGDDLVGAVLAMSIQRRYSADALVPHFSRDNCRWLSLDHEPFLPRALRRSTHVLIGGGGILGDSSARPSNRYFLLALASAGFARATGRPVRICGVGAGPLAQSLSRRLCRKLCEMSPVIAVRDPESAQFLTRVIGVEPARIVAGADPSILWPQVLGISGIPQDRIGIQFDARRYPAWRRNPQSAGISDRISLFCRTHQAQVMFFSNSRRDTDAVRIASAGQPSVRYTFLPEFLQKLAGLKAIVTSHLHLAIAAYAARIPCFSIYVVEKTRRFYSQIGRPDRAIALESATADSVDRLLEQAAEAEWMPEDEARLASLRAEADRLLNMDGFLA